MNMAFNMAMDLDNLTKLIAYLIMMISIPLALPGTSYPDVPVQLPAAKPTPLASAVEGGGTHLISHHLVSTEILYDYVYQANDPTVATPPTPLGQSQPIEISGINFPPPPPDKPNNKPVEPPASLDFSPPPPPSEATVATPPTPPPPSERTTPSSDASQNYTPEDNKKRSRKIVVPVAVSIVIATILCFAGLSGWLLIKRKKTANKMTNEETPSNSAGPHGGIISDYSDSDDHASNHFARKLPKMYSYNTLTLATSNFNEENKLGEGGFGPVFKGFLDDEKIEVAVKRVSKKAKGAPKQYKAEVKILTKLSHRNLVDLLGWCEKGGEFLLVYKFMPNGSLNSQLYHKSHLLTWDKRYNIVLGLSSALNYLHEECEECILHRDIKPDNVLLDLSFNAKLSDFGLARLVDHDLGSKSTTLAGTMGYMAPEYIQESRASKVSDMYSFGVVLLEIACGRAPLGRIDDHMGNVTNLVDVVWDHYGRNEILEMADKRLKGEYNAKQIECVMVVGLWCAHPIYTERPTIGQAMKVLKLDAPLPVLPPCRPDLLPLLADLHLLSKLDYPLKTQGAPD